MRLALPAAAVVAHRCAHHVRLHLVPARDRHKFQGAVSYRSVSVLKQQCQAHLMSFSIGRIVLATFAINYVPKKFVCEISSMDNSDCVRPIIWTSRALCKVHFTPRVLQTKLQQVLTRLYALSAKTG